MPVKVTQKAGKYRVIEAATGRIAKSNNGKPVDGGGHMTKARAESQARAINANKHK